MFRLPVVIGILFAVSPVCTRCLNQLLYDNHSEPIECPPPPASPPLAANAPRQPPSPPAQSPRPPGARSGSVSVPKWALPTACDDWGVLLKTTDMGTHSEDHALGPRYLVQVGVLHFRTHLKVLIDFNLAGGVRDWQHMLGFPQQLHGANRIESDDEREHAYAFVTTAPPVQYPSETFAERMDRRMRGFSFIVHTGAALTKDKLRAHCSTFAKSPSPPPSELPRSLPNPPHSPYSTISSKPLLDPMPSLQMAPPPLMQPALPEPARPLPTPTLPAPSHSSPSQPPCHPAPSATPTFPSPLSPTKYNSSKRPAMANPAVPRPADNADTALSPPSPSLPVIPSRPLSPQVDAPLPSSPPVSNSQHGVIKPTRSSPPPRAPPHLLTPITEPAFLNPSTRDPPPPHGHASSAFTLPPESPLNPSLHTNAHHTQKSPAVKHVKRPATPPTAPPRTPIRTQHSQKYRPVPLQENVVPPALPALKSLHTKTPLSSGTTGALLNSMQGLSLNDGFSANVAAFRTSHRPVYFIVVATIGILCIMCCCFTCICLGLLATDKLRSRSGRGLFGPSRLLVDDFAHGQCVPALESSEDMSESPAVSSKSLDHYGSHRSESGALRTGGRATQERSRRSEHDETASSLSRTHR